MRKSSEERRLGQGTDATADESSIPQQTEPPGRIAIIAHVYYDDLWHELSEAIQRCPREFDLYVTVSPHNADRVESAVRRSFPKARVLRAPNRGRDLGPFVRAVLAAECVGNYMAICKIHTKKGITEPETWRFLLLDSVLGSTRLIERVVSAFEADPHLALVGAQDLYVSGPKFISVNRRNLTAVARALYPERDLPQHWGSSPERCSGFVRECWSHSSDISQNA
jgi:lipopolysaccharide biosynthesis protein